MMICGERHIFLVLLIWYEKCHSSSKLTSGVSNRFTIWGLLYLWSEFAFNTLVIIFWGSIESKVSLFLTFGTNYLGDQICHGWWSCLLFLSTFGIFMSYHIAVFASCIVANVYLELSCLSTLWKRSIHVLYWIYFIHVGDRCVP